jgi:acetyl esterase/lipase
MPSDQLKIVIDMLRSAPAVDGTDVLAMRKNMEAVVAAAPRPEGVAFTPVDANGVPAEWTVADDARDDVAIVYFHGGGYVMGSLNSHRGHCARISQVARARVLSIDYRLGPEHPHPAAVEDAVAAVRFARASGFAPKRTAVAGDSAGGGLTLATLLALRDAGDPAPAAGLCISPWTDLALTGETLRTKAAEDPMVRGVDLQLMVDAYLAGQDAKHPLASPLYADFRAFLALDPGRQRGDPARRCRARRRARARRGGRGGAARVAGHDPRLARLRADPARGSTGRGRDGGVPREAARLIIRSRESQPSRRRTD